MCQYADPSDEDLMDQFYAGDDGAFAALAARYSQRLCAFFRRFVSQQDAEDLTQEVLLRVARTRCRRTGRYDRSRGTPFRTWLFCIAHNCLRTFWRDQEREPDPVPVPAETLEGVPADEPSRYEWVDYREEFCAAVCACLDALPPLRRESILLDVQGYGLPEVAEGILGIPYGTAGSRLHNARQRMRTCLCARGYRLIPRSDPVPPGAIIVLRFRD